MRENYNAQEKRRECRLRVKRGASGTLERERENDDERQQNQTGITCEQKQAEVEAKEAEWQRYRRSVLERGPS